MYLIGYNKIMSFEIEFYETSDGKCPFIEWIEGLRDIQTRAKIKTRIDRLHLSVKKW